jgi:hypothetical protein
MLLNRSVDEDKAVEEGVVVLFEFGVVNVSAFDELDSVGELGYRVELDQKVRSVSLLLVATLRFQELADVRVLCRFLCLGMGSSSGRR